MMNGVQTKFKKVLRLAYAHFPINLTITNGEKIVRKIDMVGDSKVEKSPEVKDEVWVTGTDIELVGRSAALISQSCLAKNKDIRKFLDGVYVASYGNTNELKSL